MKVLNSGILFLYFGAGYSFFQSNRIKQINTNVNVFKNTQYGKMESMPLDKLYQGIENYEINNIYFSEDLKEIYVIDKDETNPDFPMIQNMQVVNSNPILADKIVELSSKNKVHTVIMEPQNTFLNDIVRVASNSFEFVVISIILTSVIQGIVGFTRRGGGNTGPMNMGFPFFNKDKRVDKTVLNVSLSDWAGSPEVVEECAEIVSYIKNASIYKAAGAQIPKGILLDGPPGTGKTLLAKAIAGETNASFLSISGSEFVELFVGMGAAKVRSLFEEARELAPSIIFIDEIDAVGKKRSASNSVNPNDEREQTLNQLLSEMDGFLPNTDVIVIAATNRRDVLDDALLRPGRFDRLVYVPLPDRSSRESIFRLYLKNKKTTDDIDVRFLAENTGGFSGAEIKNLLNEAAIFAARKGNVVISKEDIESALEKIVVGITKKVDTRSDASKKRIAIHEIGHATLAAYFYEDFELKKVSMKSTYNGVGGYTLFNELPDVQESGLYTKDSLMKRIVIALGGKAAETLEYGEEYVSVGSSEDLKQANSLAREMVETYGMGKHLEIFSKAKTNDFVNKYSEKTLGNLDEEAMSIVQECYDWAKMILIEKKQETVFLYHMLLERRELDGQTVMDIIGRK